MNFNRFLFALAFIAVAGFTACDIVEEPIDPDRQVVSSGKKVLIEDFTGHQCGNCPRAHETVDNLKGVYGDDLVVVAIHMGGFATVSPSLGYTTDYTTDLGDALEQYYDADNVGLPVGTVNRRAFNGDPMVRHGSWSSSVAALLAEAPDLGIEVESNYDAPSLTAEVEVELEYFQPGGPEHQIVVMVTEDSIYSKQSDYSLQPPYVSSYCQKHVLRKTITNIWGDQIKNAEIFVGEKIEKTFSITLDPTWKPEQCDVIVYVMNGTTREILQVEKAHIM